MKTINTFLYLFISLFFIGTVFSQDLKIISAIQQPENSYGSDQCSIKVYVSIEYHTNKLMFEGASNYGAVLNNGNVTMYSLSYNVPIGVSKVSLIVTDISVWPTISYTKSNYTSIVCEPMPSVTFTAKQDNWLSIAANYNFLTWIKLITTKDLQKEVAFDAFKCIVPTPFYCSISSGLNGYSLENFWIQVAIYKSDVSFSPFDVVIQTKQGKIVYRSQFDGLKAPSNPPIVVTNMESYPQSGSNITKGELTSDFIIFANVLNKNTLSGISSNADYLLGSQLVPVLGSQSNATYVGISTFQSFMEYSFNLQIIDSQAAKRIGGNTYVNVLKPVYGPMGEIVSASTKVSILDDSTLVNIKADTPYNPNMELRFSSQFQQITFNYPFGISNGTLKNFSYSISYLPNKYLSGEYYAYLNGDNSVNTLITELNSTDIDTTPPKITKVEIYNLSLSKVLIRVYATDDLSGIQYITLGDNSYTRSFDLVWGTPLNGVYEKIIEVILYVDGTYRPYLSIMDNNYNFVNIDYDFPVLNFNLDNVPIYPTKKIIENRKMNTFNFTYFAFKENDVDVSNQPRNNTLCFNLGGALKTMVPILYLVSSPLNSKVFETDTPFIGAFDELKNMFCVEFTIPARIFTGELYYALYFTPFVYDSGYLQAALGKIAQLRVYSTDADQMPPVITEFTAFPSNNVAINTPTTFIGWNLRIEDKTNGFKFAEFNITSDYDFIPRTFRITPSNATSGDLKSGTYQLRVPISSDCRSQTFRISSAKVVDTQGHFGVVPSLMNANPMFKFYTSDQLSIKITCSANGDNDFIPPVLISFTSNATNIDVGDFKEFRIVKFTFSTSDHGSGISTRHNPVIFLSGYTYPSISGNSTLVSNVNGIATYTCIINIPYGFGSFESLLISIYGIADNQLNMNGYSTFDLKQLGFQYVITTTYANKPVLESTSSITSIGTTLTIYGHKFGIDASKVILQANYGNGYKNVSLSFFAGIVLITDSITPTENPFYVRVIVNGTVISNPLLVVPSVVSGPCNYAVFQTITSSWVNSEIYPFSQIAITIKNTGTKIIRALSFSMDLVDQIWGVDISTSEGTKVYTLPSWHLEINPGDSYTFGYIINGVTAGNLNNIAYNCI